MQGRVNEERNDVALEERPARVLIDLVKGLFIESERTLAQHTFKYRSANRYYQTLKQYFNEIEQLVISNEHNREAYNQNQALTTEYNEALKEYKDAKRDHARIKSGKRLAYWESREKTLLLSIKEEEIKQTSTFNAEAIEAFKKSNAAETKLQELKQKKHKRHGCVPTSKRSALDEQIKQQERLIETINASQGSENSESTRASKLNEELLHVREKVDYYKNRKEEALSEAAKNLQAAKNRLDLVTSRIEAEKLKHFSSLNTTITHGIIRLYHAFNEFNTEFQHAVNEKISNKDEVAGYQKTLLSTQTLIDQIMTQLWCNQFGNLTAKDIYTQFLETPHKNKSNILSSKPDETALARFIGRPEANVIEAKVSQVGLFSAKPVAAITQQRRDLYRDNHNNLAGFSNI